ncbi:sugar phosphate isomerase/epimerase [Glutamicibacter sp. MNS18]|uniref:sugar phosphate isomerase/epimerase family protein n=1 Tax=Glutamicibacter sp. MNS18 TaxID=2989817 RepID=UPI002235C00A|nr:sugar phosphate isomerase/epimerase [Glutamicibacter sp. MNS18]MCW4466365.1 sugar phosphate isomerase/epimerase [Glutamicibacter sp. MNS18]
MSLEQPQASGIKVGIAPDSWGVWNAEDPLQPPPGQYLREAAAAGYSYTELGPYGYLGTDAGQLSGQLEEHGLTLTGGTSFTSLHLGGAELDRAWGEISLVAQLITDLGARHLIVIPELWVRGEGGAVEGRRGYSAEEWDNFCTGHDELGRRLLEDYGVHQQFHSHADSPIGTRQDIDRLLDNTDARYLNLCLDTGHFAYYLGDNVKLMTERPDRIGYLHLKQVDPELIAQILKDDIDFATAVQMGIMVEPPFGVPDFALVLQAAANLDREIFAIVEQDMYPLKSMDQPLPIAQRTFNHISSCTSRIRVAAR